VMWASKMVNELPAQFDNQTSTTVSLSCTIEGTTCKVFFPGFRLLHRLALS
jgi:hypothetical protein